MLRIVHIPKFRSTRPVWLYHELKQLYGKDIPDLEIVTFNNIPSFRANKPQWLLDINPNGKVPALSHGPVTMFEGGAICCYFLHQFDHHRKLLPSCPSSIAMYYQLVSWCASTLDNLTATSSPLKIILPPTAPRPMDDIETNKKYFDTIVSPFVTELLLRSGGPYVCGKQFTAADVILGFHLITSVDKMDVPWCDPHTHTDIYQYIQILKSRSAYQLAVAPIL